MGLRFLVVEGNVREAREAHRAAYGMTPSESYAAVLLGIAPDGACDIAFPADEGANLPDPAGLCAYDGIVLTGSALHIYDPAPAVRRQIDLMRAVYASGTPCFGSCWGLQVGAVAAGGEVRRNPNGPRSASPAASSRRKPGAITRCSTAARPPTTRRRSISTPSPRRLSPAPCSPRTPWRASRRPRSPMTAAASGACSTTRILPRRTRRDPRPPPRNPRRRGFLRDPRGRRRARRRSSTRSTRILRAPTSPGASASTPRPSTPPAARAKSTTSSSAGCGRRRAPGGGGRSPHGEGSPPRAGP